MSAVKEKEIIHTFLCAGNVSGRRRRAERGGAKEVALALGNASRAGHDRVRRGLAHRGASTSGAGDRTGRLRRREIGDGGDSGGVVFRPPGPGRRTSKMDGLGRYSDRGAGAIFLISSRLSLPQAGGGDEGG